MGKIYSKKEYENLQRSKEESERNIREECERRIHQFQIEQLQNQLKYYQNINSSREKEDKERERMQTERMGLINAQHEKEISTLMRSIQEARNEADKKIAEEELKKQTRKKERQQEILSQFKQQKESIITEEIARIKDNFNKNSRSFCLKEIKQYDLFEVEKFVYGFEISENVEMVIFEQIKKKTNEYLQQNGKAVISHINTVLVGPSGVGKSTLINAMLGLKGNDCAAEGAADPCTMGSPRYYESLEMNFRIADSRGMEKSKEYGAEEVIADVTDFVEKQLLTKDPDKYVHCIWYCISSSRFEGIEKECLGRLSNIYENNTLPIIVVFTKATHSSIYDPIKTSVKEFNNNLEFIPVVAKEFVEKNNDNEDEDEDEEGNKKKEPQIHKKKNLKKLKTLTIEKAKQAVESSCYTGIKNIIKEEIKKANEFHNKKMEQYIIQENEKKIGKFQENMDIKEIIDNITDIICNVIKYYLYDGMKSLNKDSVDNIEYFLEKFFNKCIAEYINIFEMFIDDNSGKIAKQIYELQKEINLKNESIMGFVETEEEIRKQIKNIITKELKSKAELYCIKNAAYFISEPVRKMFSNLIMNLFEKCLKNQNTSKLFENCAKEIFNNIRVPDKKI